MNRTQPRRTKRAEELSAVHALTSLGRTLVGQVSLPDAVAALRAAMVLETYERGVTSTEAAALLGITRQAFQQGAHTLGLTLLRRNHKGRPRSSALAGTAPPRTR